MKTWILAIMMLVGLGSYAQHGKDKMNREPFTASQKAELQSKKMTLALDLNEKQQKDIQKLLTDKNTKAEQFKSQFKANREAGKKPTADERFAMQNKRLDEKIAFKGEMKKILNTDQYSKWEKMKKHRKENHERKHKKFSHRERR